MTDLELEAQYFKDSVFALGKDVAVRIEGKKHDEVFWSSVFQIALPYIQPEFYPQCFQYPSAGTTGKDCVLLLEDFADRELVLCIDSDYDFLLEKSFLQNPFLFHTYVYSIENYWCYAQGLLQVLKIATDTEGDAFDFIHFMETYSKIVYPFLLCSLFSAKQNDKQNDSLLSAENFAKQVSFTKITNVLSDLTALEHKLKTQYAPLLNFYEANITFDSFKQRLTDLGLTENEAYLFMRGHDILDRIAVKLMQNLGDALTKTHFGSLATNKEKADYYAYIKANSYEVVAEKNREMHNCAFYQRIVQDIQMAFQN